MASKNKLGEAAKASVGGFFTNTEEIKPEPTTKESRKPYTDEQMDEALKAVYRSGRQQDGADLLNINKGTFSRNKREIEENEPERVERLKAEVEAEAPAEQPETETPPQDTPQATQKPQIATEPIKAEESTPAEEKAEEKANTKPQKQSFSFRADQSKIESWKLYAEAIGTKDIGTLWTAAIDEYISNHELTADQQAIYELKKKAAEMQKKQK